VSSTLSPAATTPASLVCVSDSLMILEHPSVKFSLCLVAWELSVGRNTTGTQGRPAGEVDMDAFDGRPLPEHVAAACSSGNRAMAEALLNQESSYAVRVNGATTGPYIIKASTFPWLIGTPLPTFMDCWADPTPTGITPSGACSVLPTQFELPVAMSSREVVRHVLSVSTQQVWLMVDTLSPDPRSRCEVVG
jgi:hypothetical protein